MNKYELNFCNNIIERTNRKLIPIINKQFENYHIITDEELIWSIDRLDISEFLFINDQINFSIVQEELKKVGIDIKNKSICNLIISFDINMKNLFLDLMNQSMIRNKIEQINYNENEDKSYINFWRKFDEYDKEYFDRSKH